MARRHRGGLRAHSQRLLRLYSPSAQGCDTLVREVERNLLLGAQDRAAPARDAPTATVLLDRLVRTGQEQMASVVLDFAGGRRNGGRAAT